MITTSREEFDEAINRIEEEEIGSLDPKTRDRVFDTLKDPSKYTIDVHRSAGLGALGISKGIAEIFYKMDWSLLTPVDKNDFFITSDHPVTRIVPEKINSFHGDGGFMNPRVQVTLPLSPNRLLIMTWRGASLRIVPISRRIVHSQNKQRAIEAEARIFADRRDAGIKTLVEKYKGQRAGIMISGFGADRRVEVRRKLKP
jgi:hypothetical protein